MLLSGIRLLDLTQGRPPGAACTHLLADLGVEVIRIDSAQHQVFGNESDRSLAFDSINRNKRSIALDLKTDAGRELFYELAKTSDVILEGSRPGVAQKLGVDYDTIRALNDQIVYCSLSGFGQDGPYVAVGAHDSEASAFRGAFGHTSDSVMTSSMFGVLLADMGGGLHAALGLLAGLLARGERGEGCFIDVALADSVSTFQLAKLSGVLMNGRQERAPHLDYAFFKCKDGKFLAQASVEPHNWARWCEATGCEELIDLPKSTGAEREAMIATMREVMATKDRDEWFRLISSTGATVAPCLELEEVVDDPQVIHRGLIWDIDHPTVGPVRQWGSPIKVKGAPAELERFAPAKGADTRAILETLGYAESQIDEFIDNGVVVAAR